MTAADAAAKARGFLRRQIDAIEVHGDSIRKTFTANAIISTRPSTRVHVGRAASRREGGANVAARHNLPNYK
jgi:hypothetical protein